MFRATVVKNEQQVTFLCHVDFPTTGQIVPASIHIVGMRPSIDVDDCRIFLRSIKIHGFHHTIIQVCRAIGGFDASAGDFGHGIVFPRVFRVEQVPAFAFVRGRDVHAPHHGGGRVGVYKILSFFA